MLYSIYFLISQAGTRTYVGYSGNFEERLGQHKNKAVKITANFGRFQWQILETVDSAQEARKKERYWKSAAGRKKLKTLFHKAPSSNG